MRILVVHIHYPVSSGAFLKRALVRLGHDARSLGPSTGRAIWGVEAPEEYVQLADYQLNYEQGQGFPDMLGMLAQLGEWQPELVVTSDSSYTLAGRAPCPHILCGQDNHVRNYRNLEAEGAIFDAKFLAHSWGARIGEPNVYWCPPCYDPANCTDLGLERPLDVCMIGYPYQGRMELRSALVAAGLRGLFAIGLLWDRYNAAYNQAKIAVVQSSHDDLTNRFFEGMAQGCCVLADRTVDAEKLGFVPGVDYWPYQTPAEAAREARHLIDSGKWAEIAAAGKRKAPAHTWDVRAKQMLDTVFAKETSR